MPRLHIPKNLRLEVTNRARGLCEYCLVHQEDRPERHQLDLAYLFDRLSARAGGFVGAACRT